MNKRIYRILDKELFIESSIKDYPLLQNKGISVLKGSTKDGKTRLHAFVFSNDWPEKDILDWIEKLKPIFENVAVLPQEATDLWLLTYDEACLDGNDSYAASEIAWEKVKSRWHCNLNNKWVKLEEDWQTAILGMDKPVEIFRCGCYPQFSSEKNPEGKFTVEDMDKCIYNFETLGYHKPAAVTVDHVNSGPALGWVKSVFRVGERLFAMLGDINPRLIEKLKAREYVHRSVEMWADYFDDQQNKFIGPVLDRLTFLGVKKPQVKGMTVPTFNETKDKTQPHPLMAFSVDSPEINQSMCEFIKSNKSPQPLNPTKKGVLMELTEQQLAAQLSVAENKGREETRILLGEQMAKKDAAIAKAQESIDAQKAEIDAEKKKHEDRVKAFEKQQADAKAAEDDAKLTSDAVKLFTKLAGDGKVLADNQPAFIMQYKLAARSTEKAKLSDGKEGTALQLFIESQEKMPDLVKMGELTKKIESNNQTDSRVVAGATEASKELDAKVVAYCEANKLDVKNPAHFEQAYTAVAKAGK